MMHSAVDPAAILVANSHAYEWLASRMHALRQGGGGEAVMHGIEAAASFAVKFHSGRFADGAIENVALELGSALDGGATTTTTPSFPACPRRSRRRVLHVTSGVHGIGGLTRMLYHWVRNDRSSCHSVLMVDSDEPIPPWLSSAVCENGGNVIVLPPASPLLQRAWWLRGIARKSADLVVLHHGGADAVATAAFATDGGPPVAVLNHADHVFWLGSAVADTVINLRSAAIDHSIARRFVPHSSTLPIPLLAPDETSPAGARRMLGIGEDQVVLLSVGRDIKYRPCGSFDFTATARKVLDRHPRAHLYVVGETLAGMTPFLRGPVHDRLHFVGPMDDPSPYRTAADVYLESFPFGSQTALLEAALSGIAVVPAYAPLSPLLVANDDALVDLLPNPRDEQEYVDRVAGFVEGVKRRVAFGEELRMRLLLDHVGEGWLERLEGVYRATDELGHRPRRVPVTQCEATEMDLGLSRWNIMAEGRWKSRGLPEDAAGAEPRHSAYVAKVVGDFDRARRHALRAVRESPSSWNSWRILGAALLGRRERRISQFLRRRPGSGGNPT